MPNFNPATIDSWSEEEIAQFRRLTQRPRALAPTVEMLGAGAGGELVAEGDSWFDYPVPFAVDIIDCLRGFHGFRIEKHAKYGDTLENMIFGPSCTALMQAVREIQPKVLLFSGGGNDVAGDAFGGYLNHKRSGLPLVRPEVAHHLIDTVFASYLRHFIGSVAAASPQTFIVMHGYAHTRPTGKGVMNLPGFSFIGPWLMPALRTKQIEDASEQIACVFGLIDRYNEMLARLAAEFPKFRYVDLRPIVDPDHDWANELHLKNSACVKVAARIAGVIQAL
jgi:hypothetical protein